MKSLNEEADDFISRSGETISVPPDNGQEVVELSTAFASSAVDMIPILTSLGDQIPLILCLNIDIRCKTMVLESFESSLRMFKRGCWYPLVQDKVYTAPKAYKEYLGNNFFSYTDRGRIYRTPHYMARSQSMFLSQRVNDHWSPTQEVILMTGVINHDDFAFVMACRRHNKKIPRSLVTMLISEDINSKSIHRGLHLLIKDIIKPKLTEAGIGIKKVPQAHLDSFIYQADSKFSSLDEMLAEKDSLWKITLKELDEHPIP